MGKFPDYKREFKYTNKLEDNTAYMLLGHPIGFDEKSKIPTIIGAVFAEEMYFWAKVGKNIFIKENCPGGGIIDGFSIMDAVRTTDASVCNVGIAASMGGHIFLSARKEKRFALSYAKVMIHPPQGKDLALKNVFRDSLSQILSETSKFSATEIDNMMKEGAPDTWLDTDAMVSKGLILKKNILPTNAKPEAVEEDEPYALYNVYNNLIEKEMADITDGKTVGESLKLITELQNKATADAAAITAKDAKIAELEAQIKAKEEADKAAKLLAATALVDVAISNKALVIPTGNTTMREQYINMAQTAPDAFKAIIESKAPTKVSSVVNFMGAKGGQQAPAGQDETYEYLANYNPKKLYAMMDEDPEGYSKLVTDYQNKAKNI